MNTTSRFAALAFLSFFMSLALAGQKKIVILGSSTAAGNGASSYSNSWAGKITSFYNQNTGDGLDTIVYNLAVGGYSTYEEMPTGFVPPASRPVPDISHNITAAMSYNPDIVIINLPSNDVTRGYRINEAMNNLRQMSAIASSGGARCFVTTAQPRNEAPAMRDSLFAFKDSIIVSFGLKYIDFWSDIVTLDGTNMIRPEYNSGDGIHVNDAGHNLLYFRVRNKQVFADNLPLPLKLISFTATSVNNSVKLNWSTAFEESNTLFYPEHSTDGVHFEQLAGFSGSGGTQQKNYSWTDHTPQKGMNLYRIRFTENGRTSYSGTLRVNMSLTGLAVAKVHVSASGDLSFSINADKQQAADLRIISSNGTALIRQTLRITEGPQQYTVPVQHLPAGQYFMVLRSADNKVTTTAFIR